MLQIKEENLDKVILMGDHLLIKPTTPAQRTESGLLLPQGLHKAEDLRTGYVIKVGPGYAIPVIQEEDEAWKDQKEKVKYVPIQPLAGDLAIYLQSGVHSLIFNTEEYIITSSRTLLMLIRNDDFVE
jgi:chaperonin GroES